MYQSILRSIIFVALATLAFLSCTKDRFSDIQVAAHDAEYAFPLLETELNINDLLPRLLKDSISDDTLIYNPDGTITLFYSGDVATKYATDLFTFFQVGLVPVADTNFVAPYEAPDSLDINKAVLKDGFIQLIVYNKLADTIHGVFVVSQMTFQGDTVKIPFKVGPATTFQSDTIWLNGKTLTSDNNSLAFKYFAYTPDGQRIKVPDIVPGVPGVALFFKDMTFSYLDGYWGREVYPLDKDTIEIDINKTNLVDGLTITDPKLRVIVDNSFGFPTRGLIKTLRYFGKNGQVYDLESSYITGDGIDFDYPKLALGEIGESKRTVFYFDRNNSNIDEIFNAQPYALEYEINGVANAEADEDLVGFLTDSSRVAFKLEVELVLEGTAKEFKSDQTIDLDFGDYENVDSTDILEVEFKLVAENEMPIEVKSQIYFQDERGVVVDSLFTNGPTAIMKAAPVDASGVVSGIERTETFVKMEINRFDRIRTAKKAFIQSFMTTSEGGEVPVKILQNMKTKLKIGLKVKTRYD